MPNVALIVQTAPGAEPVTVAECKSHSGITVSDDDTLLGTYITAAREHVEDVTRRQLITATWELSLDCFPDSEIELPFPPTQSVTSIVYVDANGTTQTLSSTLYQTDFRSEPAKIMPAYSQSWPSTREDTYNAVIVRFVAGYGLAASVPGKLKIAVKMLVDHMYKHRSPTIEGVMSNELAHSLKSLLWGFKVPEIASLAAA